MKCSFTQKKMQSFDVIDLLWSHKYLISNKMLEWNKMTICHLKYKNKKSFLGKCVEGEFDCLLHWSIDEFHLPFLWGDFELWKHKLRWALETGIFTRILVEIDKKNKWNLIFILSYVWYYIPEAFAFKGPP